MTFISLGRGKMLQLTSLVRTCPKEEHATKINQSETGDSDLFSLFLASVILFSDTKMILFLNQLYALKSEQLLVPHL